MRSPRGLKAPEGATGRVWAQLSAIPRRRCADEQDGLRIDQNPSNDEPCGLIRPFFILNRTEFLNTKVTKVTKRKKEAETGWQDAQDGLRTDRNPPIRLGLCGLAHAGPSGEGRVPQGFIELDWPTEIPIQENPGVFCQRTASFTIHYSHIIVEYASSFGRSEQKM